MLWAALAGITLATLWVPARYGVFAAVVVACFGAAELAMAADHSAARASRRAHPVTAVSNPLLSFMAEHDHASVGAKVFALTSDRIDDLDVVAASLRPNSNALFGVASIDGYDGGIQVTEAWAEVFAPLANGPFRPDAPAEGQVALPLDPAVYGDLGVRWLLVDRTRWAVEDAVAAGWGEPVAAEGDLILFDNPADRGPAWLDDPDGSVQVDERRPERLTLSVRATTRSRLTVAQQWDSGWSAASTDKTATSPGPTRCSSASMCPAGNTPLSFAIEAHTSPSVLC